MQQRILDTGHSAPGLVPGQDHAVGKRPGLHQVRFTQLSRAVKNGVPPPTRTGG